MQIDGKTQAIALGLMSALGFVAALTPSMFPSFIPVGIDADIAKTSGLIAGLMGAVGTGMGLFSSSKPGPLAPHDPSIVMAATALHVIASDPHAERAQVARAVADLKAAIPEVGGSTKLPQPQPSNAAS
jgi:hypothetical protein